jgi:two-component system, sensor histidine kinase and response regulator
MSSPPRSRAIELLERLPELTSAFVAGIATIVLVNWSRGDRQWLPAPSGPYVMLPNTAIGFLIASVALWFGRSPRAGRWSLAISRLLGVVITVAGTLFFVESMLGRDLGIDLRVFHDTVLQAGWSTTGRLAPNAAVAFLLLGIALTLLDLDRDARRPALWAATGALLVAFAAIVGYVTGAEQLYTFAPEFGMALLTALCFAALSLGVLFARRDRGLAAILVDEAGGGVLARRLLPAAVVVPIVLGWLWGVGQRADVWSHANGPSLFVVASSVALVWLVVRSARVVHAADLQRAQFLEREQEARREAETANRTKGDFLAVMSHELRTPLSAIIGYQELLADGITGPVTEQQRHQLGRIKVSARHLLELIDEILTYSRAEAGKEEVQYEITSVNALVDDAAALIEPLAADKRVRFSVIRLDAPLDIRTDPRKARQVLVNLLSNAVKFTDADGTVTLRAQRAGDKLELTITDTGIGIEPDHLDRIFDPFWQVEQKATRRAGGTGLGLSVSRRLARLLGGDVLVASEPGRGSAFTVVLPAGSVAGNGAASAPANAQTNVRPSAGIAPTRSGAGAGVGVVASQGALRVSNGPAA